MVKGNGQWKHKKERLLCPVYTYFEDADELDKKHCYSFLGFRRMDRTYCKGLIKEIVKEINDGK